MSNTSPELPPRPAETSASPVLRVPLYRQVRRWDSFFLPERLVGLAAGVLLLVVVTSIVAHFVVLAPTSPQLVGRPAPDFTLKSTTAQVVQLSRLRGRPVLLQFFATLCVNCQREAPILQELHQRYAARVWVLAINGERESPLRVSEYAQRFDPITPLLLDPKHRVTRQYKVTVYPTLVLIDSSGQVQRTWVGWQSASTLSRAVEQVTANAH